ncbi:MAG: hypothetical protein JNL05_09120 [Flavobacteriales bacterium]|nr:hypothetical protein [Flavobacteriales bacterium]
MGVAVLLFTLPSTPGKAQADSIGHVPRLDLVKVGLTSTFANVISLNYERVLDEDISVAMTVSYMLPVRPGTILDLSATDITFGADRKLSGYYLTPEVKWFLETSDKRPAPRGLYVGAYLRYSDTRYTSSITANGSGTDAGGSFESHLRIDLYELGVGPSLGYQFLAWKDRLVFDCIFFAPRYSYYKLKLDADLRGDGELYSELEQAIEDKLGRDIAPLDLEISTTGSTTVGRNSLGYRYGIKIGYAF